MNGEPSWWPSVVEAYKRKYGKEPQLPRLETVERELKRLSIKSRYGLNGEPGWWLDVVEKYRQKYGKEPRLPRLETVELELKKLDKVQGLNNTSLPFNGTALRKSVID